MSIFCRVLCAQFESNVSRSSRILPHFVLVIFVRVKKNRIKGSLDDNKEPLDENDDELFANAVQTILNNNKN